MWTSALAWLGSEAGRSEVLLAPTLCLRYLPPGAHLTSQPAGLGQGAQRPRGCAARQGFAITKTVAVGLASP